MAAVTGDEPGEWIRRKAPAVAVVAGPGKS
jgi:hypothetical protein